MIASKNALAKTINASLDADSVNGIADLVIEEGLFQLWVVVPAAFLDIFLAVVFPSSVFSTRRSMGKRENHRPTDLSPEGSLE